MKEIRLPKIGEEITIERGLELCRYFGLDYLVKRLTKHPEYFRTWIFDGCSGLSQEVFRLLCGNKYKIVTFYCCLIHDLEHAYGESGNEEEREASNKEFRENLIDLAKFSEQKAWAFYKAVVIGGSDKLNTTWKWGFANKERN